MSAIRQMIPNFITLGNLACGFVAIVFAMHQHLHFAALFVLIGGGLDLFDGMVARLLNAQSDIGKQLDSLADLVTFGMAPGIIAYFLIYTQDAHLYYQSNIMFDTIVNAPEAVNNWAWRDYIMVDYAPVDIFHVSNSNPWNIPGLQYEVSLKALIPAIIFPVAGALRLAQFNTQPSAKSFKGLAIPSAGIFIAALPLIWQHENLYGGMRYHEIFHPTTTIVGVVVMAVLMVSKIPMFSLKLSSLKWRENKIQYIFLLLFLASVFFAVFIKNIWLSIPIIVILYILLSLINNIFTEDEV